MGLMNERSPTSTERDALDARLAALAARRPAAARPVAGHAGGSRTPSAPGRTKRRHAAQGSRIASLGLSVASTGALATLFAITNQGSGDQVAAASIVAGPSVGVNVAAAAVPAASGLAPVGDASVPTPTVVDVTVPPPTGGLSPDPTAAPSLSTVPVEPPVTQAPAAQAQPVVVQGGVFHNKWGDVQVQATFAPDGSLVDVVTLQTPSRDGKSVRINDRAAPQLNAEALSVQSADVHTVSGATYTSTDYRRSLQSAIDAARQVGATTIV